MTMYGRQGDRTSYGNVVVLLVAVMGNALAYVFLREVGVRVSLWVFLITLVGWFELACIYLDLHRAYQLAGVRAIEREAAHAQPRNLPG